MKWWLFKKVKKIRWPLPETDYDGNNLWALRFPKPRDLTPAEIECMRMAQNMNIAERQKYAICGSYGFGGLFGQMANQTSPYDWIYHSRRC